MGLRETLVHETSGHMLRGSLLSDGLAYVYVAADLTNVHVVEWAPEIEVERARVRMVLVLRIGWQLRSS